MGDWTHNALAADLAGHLRADRRMVWADVQLGPAGSPRPDVYAIFKSFANPAPTAYECKVTLSDFRADVTAGKWQAYLHYAGAVYFAAPAGLIGKADVPTHCGLMLRGEKGWRAAKRAVLQPVAIPEVALLKLLIDGVEREGPRYRGRAVHGDSAVRSKLGEQVAACVRDLQVGEIAREQAERTASWTVDQAREQAAVIIAEAERCAPLRAELCDLLGLSPTAGTYQIKSAIGRLRGDVAEHPADRARRDLTTAVRRALDIYGYREPEAPLSLPTPEPEVAG